MMRKKREDIIGQRRRFIALCAVALGLAGCGGGSGTPAGAAGTSTGPAPLVFDKLVFADEFNAGALDRAVWNVEGPDFWVNNEQQAYIDSSETIRFDSPAGADGGALILEPKWRPGFVTPSGRVVDFVSGRINTRDNFDLIYAKVSARIRMPDAPGVWPAFWLLGYGQWPDAGEADIMEYVGERGWTSSALHGPGYSGDTPLTARHDFPAGADATGWHVYSVERRPDSVAFFVDDREFYRVSKAEVERYGPWRFDRRQYVILNLALGGTYPQAVNSVNAPYPGLGQATVDAIRAGQTRYEVDWVRVWEPS